MGRVAVFIDGAYLEHVAKDEFGSPRIGFDQLAQAIAGKNDLLRTYCYHCLPW